MAGPPDIIAKNKMPDALQVLASEIKDPTEKAFDTSESHYIVNKGTDTQVLSAAALFAACCL